MTRDHNKDTQNLPIHSCWTLFEKFHTETWSWTSRKSWWEMLANTCLAAQTGFWVALSTWVVKLRLHLQQREKSNFHHLFSPGRHYISEGRVSKPKGLLSKCHLQKSLSYQIFGEKPPIKNYSSNMKGIHYNLPHGTSWIQFWWCICKGCKPPFFWHSACQKWIIAGIPNGNMRW